MAACFHGFHGELGSEAEEGGVIGKGVIHSRTNSAITIQSVEKSEGGKWGGRFAYS